MKTVYSDGTPQKRAIADGILRIKQPVAAVHSPIAEWRLGEAYGTTALCQVNTAQNGTHTAVTLGQTGIREGETCALYDGSTSYTDVTSTALIGRFDAAAGTLHVWAKVSGAGVWSDSAFRIVASLFTDANNRIYIMKSNQAGRLLFAYEAGGTDELVTKTSISETGWMALGLTWDKAADEVKAYYGGVQEGATQTGLGVWSGALVSAFLGAYNSTPDYVMDGYVARAAVWNMALRAGAMAELARA